MSQAENVWWGGSVLGRPHRVLLCYESEDSYHTWSGAVGTKVHPVENSAPFFALLCEPSAL